MILLNDVCFVLHVRCDPFVPLFLLSFVLILLYNIGGQFNERLLWQHFGIFLYSTVIIICFMLCLRIKYDDDDDDDDDDDYTVYYLSLNH